MDKDYLRSPVVPATPAPAYTPLANSDVSYHCTPILNGRMGDIELETTDGKRFLVHKSVLEAETVFFHIYYGFVPVWRLNGAAPAPYHTFAPSPIVPQTHTQTQTQASLNHFGGLASLRKIITSTLAPTTSSTSPASSSRSNSPCPPPAFSSTIAGLGAVPPPPADGLPKITGPVSAPTPTASPFTWLVPESSSILHAFLSLIYPPGTLSPSPTSGLTSIEITGRVIRAALGYQSTKALTLARDHLSRPDWLADQPLEVYSMACFFKFADLAKLSSGYAVKRPMEEWHAHRPVMGRTGTEKLHQLYDARIEGLCRILDNSLHMGSEEGEGGHDCSDLHRMREMWSCKVDQVKMNLGAGSELLELLEVDLRGGWCEGCLVLLGRAIQSCIVEARELPMTI